MNQLTHILFDLDDTLVDSEKAYTFAYSKAGIDVSQPAFQSARQQVKRRLGKHHPSSKNRLLYFKAYLENQGQFSAKHLLSIMTTYETAIQESFRQQWEELERPKFFEKLKQKNFTLAVLTNENTRTQMLKIMSVDPDRQYFDYILTSEELGLEKPHPDAFHQIFSTLKAGVDSTLVVGDRIEVDILPAKKIGARVVLTTEFRKPEDTSAKLDFPIINNLLDLADYL